MADADDLNIQELNTTVLNIVTRELNQRGRLTESQIAEEQARESDGPQNNQEVWK